MAHPRPLKTSRAPAERHCRDCIEPVVPLRFTTGYPLSSLRLHPTRRPIASENNPEFFTPCPKPGTKRRLTSRTKRRLALLALALGLIAAAPYMLKGLANWRPDTD